MSSMLLESIEGLDSSIMLPGAAWQLLQGEKEELCREICSADPVIHVNGHVLNEWDAPDEVNEEIEWRHREQLESRLREIVDAQDRLADGRYGRCEECGDLIPERRLVANPVASLCLPCQTMSEPEVMFHTM